MKKKAQKKPVKITRMPDGSAFAKLRIPTHKQLKAVARIPSVDKDQMLASMVYSAHRIADALDGMNTRARKMEKVIIGLAQLSLSSNLDAKTAKAIKILITELSKP